MLKDAFFESLVDACKSRAAGDPFFYGWEARVINKRSYQELLYPKKTGDHANVLVPQTVRWPIEEATYQLTVYRRHGDPVAMGNATVTIQPGIDIGKQIEEAIVSAGAVGNPPWELVKPSSSAAKQRVRLVDPKIKNDPAGAARYIREQANGCFSKLADRLLVNYGELFLNSYETRTVTGTGLDLGRAASDIYFEAAAEKLPLPNTQEVHKNTGSLSVRSIDICSFCDKLADEVFSLDDTVIPGTTESAVLLVNADTASAILHCLLSQIDATMEFAKKPFLAVGARIFSGELAADSETLSVTLDPFIDYMAESRTHTHEGLVAQRDTIVDRSIVKRRIVSNRMSQYLGIPASPVSGNIIVRPGSKSFEELIRSAERVIEIKSFSSLLLNNDYLTYSSEIKLAKEYDNRTGKTRLLEGGVVSGNIIENFSSFMSSRELMTFNKVDDGYSQAKGYRGPKYMLFKKGVAISGKEDFRRLR